MGNMLWVVFTGPKIKIGLEPSTQIDPESNANFTRTKNIKSLAGANHDVMQTMDLLLALVFVDGKTLHVYVLCKSNVFGGL